MSKRDDKTYATKLLDRLKELDFQTVEAYYDMGSIISSMQHGQLHKFIGYTSMTELIDCELTYTATTGGKYAAMYRHFRRLHYMKHEAVELLKKFGLTHMCFVLPDIEQRVGKRAIRNRINAIDQHQINFTLTQSQLDKVHSVLKQHGATMIEGRWVNSSEAFMEMVGQFSNGTPKLTAVK